jgi:glycerol-3-phosphate cytidylyltransferase
LGLRIYNGGTYDLFHWGHVEMLRRLKQFAGEDGTLIVAINTDEFVKEFKGKSPIMTTEERAAVVRACRYVDEVIINYGGQDSKPAIIQAKADFVITGTDWSDKDYNSQMGFTRDWLETNKVGFGFLPYTAGISSTAIKARLVR